MYHRSSIDYLADSLAGAVINIFIVMLIIELYLAFRAICLIIRTFVRYPKNKALWIALVPTICFTILAVITTAVMQGQYVLTQDQRILLAVVTSLATLSWIAMLITCKAVEIYHNDVFLREQNFQTMMQGVLHEPWWQGP